MSLKDIHSDSGDAFYQIVENESRVIVSLKPESEKEEQNFLSFNYQADGKDRDFLYSITRPAYLKNLFANGEITS